MSDAKRFPPSAAKLKRARGEGDIPKSREITACCILTAGVLGLLGGGGLAAISVIEFFHSCFAQAIDWPSSGWVTSTLGNKDFHTNTMIVSACACSSLWASIVLPFLMFFVVSVFVSDSAQAGIRIVWKLAGFRLSRLNPAEGLKKMCGPWAAYETVRSIVIWGCGLAIAAFLLLSSMPELFLSPSSHVEETSRAVLQIGETLLGKLLLLGWVSAMTDFMLQRIRWRNRHSMDLEELKKELRETEGHPQMRMLRKQMHQELAAQVSIQAVRRARVLVVSGRKSG